VKVKKVKKSLFHFSGKSLKVKKVKSESDYFSLSNVCLWTSCPFFAFHSCHLFRPMKAKKKLRVFITNQMYPGKTDSDNNEDSIPQWELKIEGRLAEEPPKATDPAGAVSQLKPKPRKFSSFFKSLVIELDKDLYGPDNHLVEWHRTAQTAETDGFQVKCRHFFLLGFSLCILFSHLISCLFSLGISVFLFSF
jgi:hypothetical protein